MSGADLQTGSISSTLGDPELFGEILQEFLNELPRRINQLGETLDAGDYQQLASLAHQLKGAGGGYGYPGLTELAARLESLAKQHQPSPEVLADCLNTLRDYQGRLRA